MPIGPASRSSCQTMSWRSRAPICWISALRWAWSMVLSDCFISAVALGLFQPRKFWPLKVRSVLGSPHRHLLVHGIPPLRPSPRKRPGSGLHPGRIRGAGESPVENLRSREVREPLQSQGGCLGNLAGRSSSNQMVLPAWPSRTPQRRAKVCSHCRPPPLGGWRSWMRCRSRAGPPSSDTSTRSR